MRLCAKKSLTGADNLAHNICHKDVRLMPYTSLIQVIQASHGGNSSKRLPRIHLESGFIDDMDNLTEHIGQKAVFEVELTLRSKDIEHPYDYD